MLPDNKTQALNRLKTVRGHLDGVIRMVEGEAYCVEIMKQISALQSSLERVNRLVFKNHLETCFSEAVVDGRGPEAIAELVDAVKFSPVLTGPEARLNGSAVGEASAAPAHTE
jgi:DNA-binding FrmR family transcriptional regulator